MYPSKELQVSLLEQGSIVDFAVPVKTKLEARISNTKKKKKMGFSGFFIFDSSRVLPNSKSSRVRIYLTLLQDNDREYNGQK